MDRFLWDIKPKLKLWSNTIHHFTLKKKTLENIEGEKRVLVTSREEEVLQIVLDKKAIKSSDIQDLLEVTRQQAHNLLSSLVKKGLLQKFGKTKTSYYMLAKQSGN